MKRVILETGAGNDLYGEDQTKAAARAIEDALRHSSLPMFEALGIPHSEMEVRVTVAVPKPEEVDCASLAARLPRGRASVKAVFGGQRVDDPETGQVITIALAAVEAWLPEQTGWKTC